MIAKNQPVVFAKQSVVYINNIENQRKSSFKECKDTEINRECLYWFTLYQELHLVLNNH